MSRFSDCLPLILRYEGGYANNPADHGGATMRGITQAVYSSWLNAHGRPTADVKSISDADVSAIYKHSYWDACCCDGLPAAVDLVVFDAAVNSGPSQSAKWLQHALALPADGVIGPKTLAGVLAVPPKTLGGACLDQREAFVRMLSQREGQAQFLKGWLARIADLRARL